MPDLSNRDDIEAEIARKLGRVSREALNEIMDSLGDPPDLSNMTEEKWRGIQERYESVVISELEKVFVAAATTAMDAVGIGIDFAVVNERAASWATQYGFDLVRDMTTKRRQFLQRSVSDFFRTGMTIGDLRTRLERDYSPVRASMIAITETTRAAVEGERAYIRQLEQQGVKFRHEIQTAADDRVCAICGPKQGKDPTEVGYPPFHISCRCWFVSEPIIEGVSG